MNPITITPQQYDTHRREGDGICSLCKSWLFAVVDPEATNTYCSECENRSVYGIKTALNEGIVKVV